MKIINTHYIPLPEPRWLIVDPIGNIYEQIGTLTVVEDASKNKGEYNIKTHSHPVVANPIIDSVENTESEITYSATLTHANGEVLDNILVEECTPICLSRVRSMNYLKFNGLAFRFLTSKDFEDFHLEDFIDELRTYSIKLLFPKEELQEIEITTFSGSDLDNWNGADIGMLISDLTNILFVVPFWAHADMTGVYIDEDEIFMEFVNQARAYRKINPKYRFHFKSSVEEIDTLIDKLNNELNDYLGSNKD